MKKIIIALLFSLMIVGCGETNEQTSSPQNVNESSAAENKSIFNGNGYTIEYPAEMETNELKADGTESDGMKGMHFHFPGTPNNLDLLIFGGKYPEQSNNHHEYFVNTIRNANSYYEENAIAGTLSQTNTGSMDGWYYTSTTEFVAKNNDSYKFMNTYYSTEDSIYCIRAMLPTGEAESPEDNARMVKAYNEICKSFREKNPVLE